MYVQTTRLIKVIVTPAYLKEQSDPLDQQYVWAYTIQLENMGPETVKLINRYWHITDALGVVQEVRGEGLSANSRCWSQEMYTNTPAVQVFTPRQAS